MIFYSYPTNGQLYPYKLYETRGRNQMGVFVEDISMIGTTDATISFKDNDTPFVDPNNAFERANIYFFAGDENGNIFLEKNDTTPTTVETGYYNNVIIMMNAFGRWWVLIIDTSNNTYILQNEGTSIPSSVVIPPGDFINFCLPVPEWPTISQNMEFGRAFAIRVRFLTTNFQDREYMQFDGTSFETTTPPIPIFNAVDPTSIVYTPNNRIAQGIDFYKTDITVTYFSIIEDGGKLLESTYSVVPEPVDNSMAIGIILLVAIILFVLFIFYVIIRK